MEEGVKPTCAGLLSNDKLPGCRKSKAGTTKSSHANVCGDVENPNETVFKINRTESDFTVLWTNSGEPISAQAKMEAGEPVRETARGNVKNPTRRNCCIGIENSSCTASTTDCNKSRQATLRASKEKPMFATSIVNVAKSIRARLWANTANPTSERSNTDRTNSAMDLPRTSNVLPS